MSVKILVKVGGAILDDARTRASFAASVASARGRGDEVVVVHGGGAQVTRLTESLGLVPTRVKGLRVTDGPTARAVLQALAGEVNATLVATLERSGVGSVGITGADGGLFDAEVLDPALGHVGQVKRARGAVLERFVAAGFTPVVATVAPSEHDPALFLNVNADAAVAPLAKAWAPDVVLFLSDVAHVRGVDGPLDSLDQALADALQDNGTIIEGMIPKVAAALAAAEAIPGGVVKIASGQGHDPITAAMTAGGGTHILGVRPETELLHG